MKINFSKENTTTNIIPDYPYETWRFAYLRDNGYDFARFGLRVINVDDFISHIQGTFPDCEFMDMREFGDLSLIRFDELIIEICKNDRINIYTRGGPEYIQDFLNDNKDVFKCKIEDSIKINYYFIRSSYLDDRSIEIDFNKTPKIYKELYPDIDIEILTDSFNKSDDSILILYGEPGTGKTTFIKHVLETKTYSKIAYVKDQATMESPYFWAEMSSGEHDLLIFDDLDFALAPRKKNEDAKFVSNLLSFSDGIFNQRPKVIITTNQKVKDIDEALLRPGRCFDFLTLNPLSYDQALEIWLTTLNRSAEEFNSSFGESFEIITQSELMSEYRKLLANNSRNYIKRGEYRPLRERLQQIGINVGDSGSFKPFVK